MSYYIDRPRRRWPWIVAVVLAGLLSYHAYITSNRAYAGALTTAYLVEPIRDTTGKVVKDSAGKPIRRLDVFEALVQHVVANQPPE